MSLVIIQANSPVSSGDALKQRVADIWDLMDKYRAKFEHDQVEVMPDFAVELAQADNTFLIQHNGDTVGLVLFSDIVQGLKATCHAVIEPALMVKAFKQKVFQQIIQDFVSMSGVKKLKAEPIMSEKSAMKFLKLLGFKRIAVLSHEVSVKGQSMPVVLYQLSTKHYGVAA